MTAASLGRDETLQQVSHMLPGGCCSRSANPEKGGSRWDIFILKDKMSELSVFNFDSHSVRTTLDDSTGEPLFVAKDVCEVLGYKDPTTAVRNHCKGVPKQHPLQTPGGLQDMRVLREPDVLRLVIGSTLPAAERFEAWVFDVVLPSIRKTGSYSHAVGDLQSQLLADKNKIISLQEQLLLSMQKRKSYINYDEKDRTNHVTSGEKITRKILNYLAKSGETPVWRVIKALKMDKATGTPYIHQLVISQKVTLTTHKPEGGKTRHSVMLA